MNHESKFKKVGNICRLKRLAAQVVRLPCGHSVFFYHFRTLIVLTYVIFEKAFGGVAVLFDLGFVLIPIAEHKLYKKIYHPNK
jgi:hypothetical protein